jgi:hypothetical protein
VQEHDLVQELASSEHEMLDLRTPGVGRVAVEAAICG